MNDSSRGGTSGREVQAMGDAEELKDPKLEAPNSTPEQREISDQEVTDEAGDGPSAAVSGSQTRAPARRSSIRPAPADYRPNVRDPSTMRPMMVVRAGDAEPAAARLDISAEETRQPPEAQLDDSIARVESSMPTEALCARAGTEEVSWAIPRAPAVPTGLVPETIYQPCLGEDSALAPDSAGNQGEPQFQDVDGAAVPVAGPESISTQAVAIAEQRAGGSNHVASSVTSKRMLPRIIVAALAAIALVSVVAALHSRVTRSRKLPTQQPVAVERLSQPPPAIAQTQAAPVTPEVREVRDDGVVAEKAAPEQAAVEAVPSPVTAAAPNTTRVTLSLKPIDARAYVRGHEVPGPPFEFDIAKGEHIAVEVVRFGFVTARVVLDDRKPAVSFGMLRARFRKEN